MTFPEFPISRLSQTGTLPLLAALWVIATGTTARAATIGIGDVTSALGPAFFVDDAVIGGGDVTVTQPSVASYNRSFAGLLTPNMGPTRVTLTGFGFATSTAAAENTAATITVTFTYLGADEAAGGGDDVVIGSASGTYAYTTNGEYVFAFDEPITAELDITGTRFLIQVAPANDTNDGKVRFKTGPLAYEAANGPKFSVAGIVAPQRVNLAKFQPVTTSSVSGQRLATYLTDGNAGNDNRWQSEGGGPHWARVDFPYPVEVGSAQVFTGFDDSNVQANFSIQYLDGESWVDAPGSAITGNTNIERNIVFTSPVTASSFRIHSTDGTMRVRELALYPPHGETGFPLGTDVRLNLAQQRPATATARTAGNFALLAVDGRVNEASKWQTSTAGTQALEIDLRVSSKIGSAHLYSGSSGVAPLADFELKYWDGSAWQSIPGGAITGNTLDALVISFTTPVTTDRVMLEFANPGVTSVRELCVFAANEGNAGYPLGTGVTGLPPLAAKPDDYRDSFHLITNAAAGEAMAVSDGEPGLNQSSLTLEDRQYQILLNLDTGTYRMRNRATGHYLSGAQLSKTPGDALIDAPYTALPDQDWILDVVDGTGFCFINLWSGLAIDTQGGATVPGTPLVQNVRNGSPTQSWQIEYSTHSPKKGVGGTSVAMKLNANWAYNWGLANSHTLPAGAIHHPMQWGNFNWNFDTSNNSTWKLYPAWRTAGHSLHLLGFNEPDKFNQSGNSLDLENTNADDFSLTRSMQTAVALWPRLQAMDMPLVSPAPAVMTNGWLGDFYTNANTLGYRVDYTALHTYPGPNGGSSDNLVNFLQTGYNNWNRPVWLTEFSFVSWDGNGTWTEEDNYNCLAEFMWRAESLPWLHKYALFIFTEGDGGPNNPAAPAPEWPWSPVGPRSNSIDANGNLTAFGKLYAGWDGDATVRANKRYYIHNKSTRKRLASNPGQTTAAARNIRNDSPINHWTLVSTGANNRYYIVSQNDGRRLSSDGTNVSLAAPGTTGSAVEWSLTAAQHGWHYLNHPASSQRLRMTYNNSTFTATYTMEATTNTTDSVQWRFIVPLPPAIWSGATSTDWTDAGNWASASVPATGDQVTFDSTSTANLDTVLTQDFDLAGVTVKDPAGPVTIGGIHTLTLGNGGLDLASATRDLAITSPLVLSAAQSWNIAGGRVLGIGGTVSGAFDLTIAGAGKVSLNAENVLPVGVAAGNLAVSGTLDLNGTSQSINALTGSGVIDNSAPEAATLSIGNNDAAFTLDTLLQNTGGSLALHKTGSGNLTLPNANTHSGGFTNHGTGSVFPQNGDAFGTGPVAMNGATIYATAGSYAFTNALTLNGATLRIGGGNNRTLTWAGPVSVTADSTIRCDGGTGGITLSGGVTNHGFTLSSAPNGTVNTISGPIGGSGTVMADSFSNGILNLDAANPFSGTYRAALGTLRTGDPLALQSGTLDMNAEDAGTVNLNNLNATIGALTGTRDLSLGSGTVSIGNNHADTEYSGTLSGSGSLVKTGNGTLTLSGPNNHSGTTSVNAGTLALGANDVLPNTALTIGDATLNAASFTDTLGTLDVTGTATIHLGNGAALAFANSSAIDWSGGSLDITGAFDSGSSLRFGDGVGSLTPAQLALITVNGGGTYTLDASGYLIESAGSGFSAWQAANTTAGGLDEDHDGDGVPNGIEYFLGGATDTTGATPLPGVTNDGGTFSVTWTMADDYGGEYGTDFTVETSATLAAGSWTTETLDGNVSISGKHVTYSFPAGGNRFVRLKVTGP